MDVLTTITAFKRYLAGVGYADRTVESYRQNLAPFVVYLMAQGVNDLRKVTGRMIEEYQAQVAGTPLAEESKALRLRPVKRLFEHLVETHRLLINPTEGIVETCRKHRRIGPVLTRDEIKKLFVVPDLALRPHMRNRVIMEVLYATGIRIDELVNLEVSHVDLADNVLFIRKAKGRKQRVVPLGKRAAGFLKEYLEKIRSRWAGKREPRLFLNHHGRPLSADSVRAFLRTYRLAAGIEKPVSPHTLRRTCATHMLQAGADIRYVQKLLGHSRLGTTQFYTKIAPVDVKEAHRQTHPGIKESDDED